jgi:hypothetical protein
VPRVLVWDGEGAIGRWRGGRNELTGECQTFRGTLGSKVLVCRPADPEAKGLIERAHDYLERSFLPTDFNTQLADWLAVVNTRPRRDGVTPQPAINRTGVGVVARPRRPTELIDDPEGRVSRLPAATSRINPSGPLPFTGGSDSRRPKWACHCVVLSGVRSPESL